MSKIGSQKLGGKWRAQCLNTRSSLPAKCEIHREAKRTSQKSKENVPLNVNGESAKSSLRDLLEFDVDINKISFK